MFSKSFHYCAAGEVVIQPKPRHVMAVAGSSKKFKGLFTWREDRPHVSVSRTQIWLSRTEDLITRWLAENGEILVRCTDATGKSKYGVIWGERSASASRR
jgi:hypothetical protein